MELHSSREQSHKIGLQQEEVLEMQRLVLEIQLMDAQLRRLTARRDEIVLGWQRRYEILDWRGWQIDLKVGTLTPPAENSGMSGV